MTAAPEVGIRPVPKTSLADKWNDALLAFCPVEYTTSNNGIGSGADPVCKAQVIYVAADGSWRDEGVTEVYWRVVIGQLKEWCNDEYPWLTGKLTRMGGRQKYMELRPPTPDEQALIAKAVTAFLRKP